MQIQYTFSVPKIYNERVNMKFGKFGKLSLVMSFVVGILYAADYAKDKNNMQHGNMQHENSMNNMDENNMQHNKMYDDKGMHKGMKDKKMMNKCKEGDDCKKMYKDKGMKDKNMMHDNNMNNMMDENNMMDDNKENSMQGALNKSSSPNERMLYAMHKPMMTNVTSNSKNIDLDFFENMIPHHQGAIDSSKLYLEFGSNDKLKKIATEIINSQEEEIRFFTELIEKANKNSVSEKYDQYSKESKKAMASTMDSMYKVKPSKNIDLDFAKSMIEHHKGAIDSSNVLLKYSSNEDSKEVANLIIKKQKDEIKFMQEILKTL